MGLTSFLALILLALVVIMIKFVIDGLREKKWQKSVISIIIFCTVIFLLYFALIRFVTSM